MEVTRTQYPIGQGCFHAGHVRWNENSRLSDDFRYVYDCGSSDGSAALQDSIVAWRTHASRIDALFVSHLDADHVNGLDRLLGSVNLGGGWTIDKDRTCAVWDRGFLAFLTAPGELERVLVQLG